MSFYCPSCHAKIGDIQNNAQVVRCPGCNTQLDVPAEDQEESWLGPGEILAGYEVVRLIGYGGMGEVYLAKQLSLGREVALKIIPFDESQSEKITKRFLNEVRATAALEHSNIVSVFEAGLSRGFCYLAMLYIEGESLDQTLDKLGGPIAEKRSLEIVKTVAEALDFSWRKKRLMHRDIKPANIMVDITGDIKLLDLGIAKRPGSDTSLTRKGIAVGTPHYMSPEQARGETELDFSTDIYSLGTTLFHLATGTRPYEDESVVGVLTMQVNAPTPSPQKRNPALSDHCAKLIEMMMQKEPENRHADWASLIRDIDHVIKGRPPTGATRRESREVAAVAPVAVRSERVAPPSATPSNRGTIALTVAVVILAVLLAIRLFSRLAPPALPDAGPQIVDPADTSSHADPPKANESGTRNRTGPAANSDHTSPVVKPTSQTLEERLREKIRARESPLTVAEEALAQNDVATAVNAWSLCMHIRDFRGEKDAWAIQATEHLLKYYERQGSEDDQFEAIALMRINLIKDKSPEKLGAAIGGLSEFYQERRRTRDWETFMQRTMEANHGGNWQQSGHIALQLLKHYHNQHNEKKVEECLKFCWEKMNDNISVLASVRTWARVNAPDVWEAMDRSQPDAELSPAQLQQLSTLAARERSARDPATRGGYLVAIGDLYAEAGQHDTAIQKYAEVIGMAWTDADTTIPAEAYLKTARSYQALGKTAKVVGPLEALIEKKYYGKDQKQGLAAIKLIANYYEGLKSAPLQANALETLINEFGRNYPADAAGACFQLLNLHKEKGNYALMDDVFYKIRDDFPGDNGEHALRARELRADWEVQHPREMSRGKLFRHHFTLYGANRNVSIYLEPTTPERKQLLATFNDTNELTVEAWLRLRRQANTTQYIISNYSNGLGFGLYITNSGQLYWRCCDGKQEAVVKSPAVLPQGTWVHVAATVGRNGMALFIDGQPVARYTNAFRLSNHNAGQPRIGASARGESFLAADVQNVIVDASVVYEDKFVPRDFISADRMNKCYFYLQHQGDTIAKPKLFHLDLGALSEE